MATDIQTESVTATKTQRIRAAVIPLFPTWVYQCNDGPQHLNESLEALTRRLMQDDRNATCRTNVGGWHYAFDFFKIEDPVVHLFRDQIQQHVQAFLHQLRKPAPTRIDRFRLEGWINVNRSGDENLLHCHPGSFLSGTYYVKTAAEMRGGEIVFRDPRGPAVAMYQTPGIDLPWVGSGIGIRFRPAAGQLLIFPAWVEHRVAPFHGEGDRISIAFNVTNP
jgi:uncharacterized protein (TIGR02466 family)